MAQVARNRARTLRPLPNPHRCAVSNCVAMDHILVQTSQLRVLLDDDVQIMPSQPTEQLRPTTFSGQFDDR